MLSSPQNAYSSLFHKVKIIKRVSKGRLTEGSNRHGEYEKFQASNILLFHRIASKIEEQNKVILAGSVIPLPKPVQEMSADNRERLGILKIVVITSLRMLLQGRRSYRMQKISLKYQKDPRKC